MGAEVIAVTPTNEAGRALRFLTTYPSQLDASALGLLLRPLPRRRAPFRSWGDRVLWRESCEVHKADSAAHASMLLEQLRRRKLTEARGLPRVAPWFLARVARVGLRLALDYAALGCRARVKIRERHTDVLSLADGTGSLPPYETIAALGRGPAEAYRELVLMDVLIPPSRRTPTEAGLALVASWPA